VRELQRPRLDNYRKTLYETRLKATHLNPLADGAKDEQLKISWKLYGGFSAGPNHTTGDDPFVPRPGLPPYGLPMPGRYVHWVT
jgi:hypothetical protein